MSEFSAIGQPRPIIDGKAKVSGRAQYVTDLQLPGMLHARFVPSVYAHANVRRIEGGFGHHFSRQLVMKAVLQHTRIEGVAEQTIPAVQASVRF